MLAYVRTAFTDDTGTYGVGQAVNYDDETTERLVVNGILTLEGPSQPVQAPDFSWPEPDPEPEVEVESQPEPEEEPEPEPQVEAKPKKAAARKRAQARKKA